MSVSNSRSLLRAAVFPFLFAFSTLIASMPAQAVLPQLATPTLSFSNPTQTTIDITVTAGATGAPFGFTIQWMTQADYIANGNVFSSVAPLGCDASFAGEAAGSRYPLAPGQSITVIAGNFVQDNGFSTSCLGPLVCGTAYVFRVFAHGGGGIWRPSPFSQIYVASTAPCSTGCTLTQGYWKTHGPIPVGNNLDTWPVNTLSLGATSYTDLQLLSILNQQPLGNGLVSLAHQLIAAKLSIANGADATAIASTVAAADALIGLLVVPPVGSDFLDPSVTDTLTKALDVWLNANECNSTDT